MLLRAGWLPLPWFLCWVTLAGAIAPGYSPLAQHASELTQKPGIPHWLVNLAALGTGLGFCLFAVGLWRATGRRVSVGALSWFLFGIAMASNGIWPMGSPLHGLYSLGIINLIAPSLALIETPTLRDKPNAYALTVFVSLAGILYLWLNISGNDPDGYRGLTQRAFSSINSLWPAVIAYTLIGDKARA